MNSFDFLDQSCELSIDTFDETSNYKKCSSCAFETDSFDAKSLIEQKSEYPKKSVLDEDYDKPEIRRSSGVIIHRFPEENMSTESIDLDSSYYEMKEAPRIEISLRSQENTDSLHDVSYLNQIPIFISMFRVQIVPCFPIQVIKI